MTPAERRAVVEALPAEMTGTELVCAEGDAHFDAKSEARDTLRMFFVSTGRRTYAASELTVHYPDEDRFSPDLFAVCDVEPCSRAKWVVSDEGKGLDWVLDVQVSGNRQRDLEKKRVRYARLRIPEYFVYDRTRDLLWGWRLADPSTGTYEAIIPQRGVLPSKALGLGLRIERRRLRFYHASALLLTPRNLIDALEDQMTDVLNAHEAAEQRAEAAEQRAETAEQRVRALEAELERLRRG